MDFNFLDPVILRIIRKIEYEFQRVKGLILTEDDLKCLMYSNLMMIRTLSCPQRTNDDVYFAHSIHTELSWFDENETLGIKPDITLLEPQHLNIINEVGYYNPLPSKQCSFGGKSIIFELKFNRETNGINRSFFQRYILGDFQKIERLFAKLERENMLDDVFCYFVIFNKTNKVCTEFDDFLENNRIGQRHKIIYCTGNVETNSANIVYSNNLRIENVLGRYSHRIPIELIGRDRREEYCQLIRRSRRNHLT